MKSVIQHAAATFELAASVAWYEQRESGLGERFYAAVQATKRFIRENPQLGTPHQRDARKHPVNGFPYLVIYRDEPERILVVAIAHAKRRPNYWQHRLQK